MTDTSGHTLPAPYATWDRDSSCWKTSEATSLWVLTLSSLTLPTWGGLAAGDLYELPMPELPTIGPASSLLRTPTAQLATNGGSQHPDKRKAGGHGPTLADEVEHLLPTPTARDHKGANQRGDATCLHGALLPTPTVQQGRNATSGRQAGSQHHDGWTLNDVVYAGLIGDRSAPLSTDGSASPDDPHQPLLRLDDLAHPA